MHAKRDRMIFAFRIVTHFSDAKSEERERETKKRRQRVAASDYSYSLQQRRKKRLLRRCHRERILLALEFFHPQLRLCVEFNVSNKFTP